jgi:hypothetical protein
MRGGVRDEEQCGQRAVLVWERKQAVHHAHASSKTDLVDGIEPQEDAHTALLHELDGGRGDVEVQDALLHARVALVADELNVDAAGGARGGSGCFVLVRGERLGHSERAQSTQQQRSGPKKTHTHPKEKK